MENTLSFSPAKRISVTKNTAFLILVAFLFCVVGTGVGVYYLTTYIVDSGGKVCPIGTDDSIPSHDHSRHDEIIPIPPETTTDSTSVTETVLPDKPQQNVRLSRSVLPTEYEVKIVPFLDEKNLTFRGEVAVLLKVLEETNNITMHVTDLDIDKSSITVRNIRSESFAVNGMNIDKDLQFLILTFPHALPVDEYIVRIKYTGALNNAMQGFYRSSYVKNNQTRWIAATQFQPTDARRAFPCFDEPAFKAAFTVTIGRPNNMSSISNMPKTRSEPVADIPDYTWDYFERSVPMSTYLVAFVVSDFTSKTDGKVTVWAREDAIGQTRYSLKVASPILEYYKNFFEIPYPLPKMDMVALPDFSAGAMENWGLLTYRESNLLYEEGVSRRSNMQRISIVVAHELAHQWFGNLVTPVWWTDLWLNEGFASYLEYLGTNSVNPEWKVLDQFVINELQMVFRLDALKSSHPISIEVNHPDEINDIFDRISYGKGATIIRMMDNILGTEVFRKGLKRYLKEKEYSNAQQDDLWESLTIEAHNDSVLAPEMTVKEIMDTWTLQMGYPLLTVERNYDGNSVKLKQERFVFNKTENEATISSKWWIPITFGDNTEKLTKQWMRNDQQSLELSTETGPNDWLLFNLNQTGYYRVNYDAKNWALIISQLKKDHNKFDPKNRAQILDDALNLAFAGYLNYDTALDVTTYLEKENDYVPWVAAFRSLDYLDAMFVRTGHYDLFKDYMLKLLTPLYRKLGFRDSTSDPLLTTYIKSEVLSRICRLNYRDCLNNANLKFKNWQVSIDPNSENPIEANLKGTVYCTAVRIGGEIEWNFLWERYLTTNVGTEKELIQSALACTKETWLLNKYLSMAVTEGSGIRKQDAPSVFSAVASNVVGQPLAYRFLTTNWDQIKNYMGSSFLSLNGMIRSVSVNFNTDEEVRNLKDFAKLKHKDLASSMRPVNQAIESAEANIDWMHKHFDAIKTWLNNNKN